MRNEVHIFDIDNTLWKIDRDVWIIDKDKPSVPLMKISESDFNLLKSGIYRSQGNKVNFNGEVFHLPKSMIENLKVRLKKEDANIENLGISLQEYTDKEIIKNHEFDLLIENILHLKNKNESIFLISSRSNKNNYKSILDKLESKLNEEGINIDKFYYINDTFYNQNEDENKYKKSLVILEHLTGFKIKEGEFIMEEQDDIEFSPTVNYYDTVNIENIQEIFEKIFNQTKNDLIKKEIKQKISKRLEVNLINVTTNELNRFIENKIILENPRKIMLYESFLNFKNP